MKVLIFGLKRYFLTISFFENNKNKKKEKQNHRMPI